MEALTLVYVFSLIVTPVAGGLATVLLCGALKPLLASLETPRVSNAGHA